MKSCIGIFIGLLLSVSVSAESLLEGRVRLESGQPVADAQVRIFDLTDLRQGAIARAMTDGTGYFALPLAALAGSVLPESFTLGPNYPNPFNPSTIIPYQLAASSQVRLEVFNLLGQRIATLVDGERPAGFHTATWYATDGAGRAVAAGVYIYRMTVGEERQTGRMVLIDGQAGRPAAGSGGSAAAVEAAGEAAVYGLTVSGPGLVSYVNPAFRVEADRGSVDLVVETLDSTPRTKVAATGILGDVDNNAQVDLFDALLVALYSGDASLVLPNHGAISLGDVNADGQVDRADAGLISAYGNDPSDPSLPAGLGKRVSSATASLSPDPSTVSFADDGIWHRFTVQASESVSVVVNPGATNPRLELTTRSGRDNYCPGGADDAVSREDGEAIYLAGCAAGTATVELRRESDDTVLQTYTFTVSASPADLVVSASVSASSLTPGQSFTLSATVRNQGTAAAAATTLRYYRSSNRTISWQDTQIGSDAVSALAASATSAESIILTAPSDVGTYYYGACLERKSGESAGNNCSTGVRVTVDANIPKKVVRVLYVSPEDRPFRSEYSEGISKAIVDVQSWYRDQLGGLTFYLYNTSPEWCQMSEDSDYYSRGNAWEKVMEGVQHCAPVAWESDFVWVLYVDVDEACDEPHELGAGGGGITMVPRGDLEGLLSQGEEEYYYCDEGPYRAPLSRWFGGLAHELAHAVGVPHPPGCDAGLPTCDSPALMWLGYLSYPDTYLRFDEKEILIRSPFITGEATPTDGPDATEGSLGVHGVVLDPSGLPVEGIRLSLVADTFWNWGETGQDGTFQIGVPEEASGSVVVSVHSGKAASCNWLGYHGPSGLTSRREGATQVAVGATDAAGIEIELPSTPDVLCGRDRTISGTVLGPDGRPVEGVWVEIFDEWWFTEQDGTFEFIVPEGVSKTHVYIQNVDDCGLGDYGPNGLINWGEEVSLFEIGQVDLTGIEIRLAVSLDECQPE